MKTIAILLMLTSPALADWKPISDEAKTMGRILVKDRDCDCVRIVFWAHDPSALEPGYWYVGDLLHSSSDPIAYQPLPAYQ